MSIDFRLSKTLRFSDLLDGRLERFGVREQMTRHTSDRGKCLTDGDNFLWIDANEEGFISFLTRNGANDPNKILGAIAEAFRTDIYSEYEPQFWGFDTEEEWDAWQRACEKEYEDNFYADILKFVADEPNGIVPGTYNETCAQIAKRLVSNDRGLAAPDRRAEFMQKIHSIYAQENVELPF